MKLRAFGQEIIRRLGERRVNPIFGIPGGVTKPLAAADREWILSQIADQMATTLLGISLFKDWAEKNREVVEEFAVFPSAYMGLVQPDGALELYHGEARPLTKRPTPGQDDPVSMQPIGNMSSRSANLKRRSTRNSAGRPGCMCGSSGG